MKIGMTLAVVGLVLSLISMGVTLYSMGESAGRKSCPNQTGVQPSTGVVQ